MFILKIVSFVVALSLSFVVQAEQLYKCQSADGGISYSSEPCAKTDATVKTIKPGDGQGSVTVVPSERRSGDATPAAEDKTAGADSKKCAAYGAEIRDIDSRLSHGFVAGEEDSLKARRKTLTDAAYRECFSENR